MRKKALVVVSFGTTYPAARCAIEKLEERLRSAFPDHDFYRAFTSRMVAAKIEREEGIYIPSTSELMEQLVSAGYDEVRCQSLHVIFGIEYEKMRQQMEPFRGSFKEMRIGAPLLWDTEDYLQLTEALRQNMPQLSETDAYVFMGHGTEHPANAAYALVENAFRYQGTERVYVGTVEGFPDLSYVQARLRRHGVTRVHLAPLMIVAGDHAQNDLAGEEDDSWKKCLEGAGYAVQTHLNGLGELDAVGDIFVRHCKHAV